MAPADLIDTADFFTPSAETRVPSPPVPAATSPYVPPPLSILLCTLLI